MTGTRYRIVTVQGGEAHTSSVVLGADEVEEHLEFEETLHHLGGWRVARLDRVDGFPEILCVRGVRARRIYARAFTPMEDTVSAGRVDHSPSVPGPSLN